MTKKTLNLISEIYKKGEYIIYRLMLYKVLIDNVGKIPDLDYEYFEFIRLLGRANGDFEFNDITKYKGSIGGKNVTGGNAGHKAKDRNHNITGFDCRITAR